MSGGYGNLVEIDRAPTSLYRIDPNIKHPRVDQFTLGFERALSSDFRLAVTGIFRQNKNAQGSVLPSARWAPKTVTNGLTGQPLTVYSWINEDESDADRLHTNPDGFQYKDENGKVLGTAKAKRDYKALMVVLSKRLSKRWQAQASYVYSKVEGTVDNAASSVFGYQRYFYETPTTAIVNSEGPLTYDRPHEVKIFATYQIPKIDDRPERLLPLRERPHLRGLPAVLEQPDQLPDLEWRTLALPRAPGQPSRGRGEHPRPPLRQDASRCRTGAIGSRSTSTSRTLSTRAR